MMGLPKDHAVGLDPQIEAVIEFVAEKVGKSMLAPGSQFRHLLVEKLEGLRAGIDEEPLVYALIATDGRYQSSQERAVAIIKRLRGKK